MPELDNAAGNGASTASSSSYADAVGLGRLGAAGLRTCDWDCEVAGPVAALTSKAWPHLGQRIRAAAALSGTDPFD